MAITEATTINLGLLLTIGGVTIGILIGGIKWLTSIWNSTKGNTEKIIHIEEDVKDVKLTMTRTHAKMKEIQSKQNEQLARIEENLKSLTKVMDTLNNGLVKMANTVIEKFESK